jgi:hypothetical protein
MKFASSNCAEKKQEMEKEENNPKSGLGRD